MISVISLFQKGVYPLRIHGWLKKFNQTLLPERKYFYNHLNMEDITDADYIHTKKVCKNFKRKRLRKYCYLYVQSDELLTVDVLESFRNSSIKIYDFDFSCFSYFSMIMMPTAWKKSEVILDLLTDIDTF